MLEARALQVMLGDYQALWDARLAVRAGEIVAILGPNGSGKSTLMNTISGLLRPRGGDVLFESASIAGLPPHRIVPLGISHVLERRRLFPHLTVRQNVWLGGYAARATRAEQFQRVSELFPLGLRNDARDRIEGNEALGALFVAVEREGHADPVKQQFGLTALLRHTLRRRIGQPRGERAEMRAYFAVFAPHLVVMAPYRVLSARRRLLSSAHADTLSPITIRTPETSLHALGAGSRRDPHG
jgi:energy-coupling factor transporter ATP-binding protein EcfA2